MKTKKKRPRSSKKEEANRIEKVMLEKPSETGVLQLEGIPGFPVFPDSENAFREERIPTEEEEAEKAPLTKEVDNEYGYETSSIGLDTTDLPGDELDENQEHLGRPSKKTDFALDEETYVSIPKPRHDW